MGSGSAARSRRLRLISKKNGELRPPPPHTYLYNYVPERLIIYGENPQKIQFWKNPRTDKAALDRDRIDKVTTVHLGAKSVIFKGFMITDIWRIPEINHS